MTALHVSGLSKSYRRGQEQVTAFRDVALTLDAGEVVALTGPSGSGKTSLLNAIAGYDRPDGGRVMVGDFDLTQADDAELDAVRTSKIGFVFQQFNLLAGLTALENVEVALTRAPIPPRERTARAKRMLVSLGLEEHLGRRPALLSGGQQQRVAIARAMVGQPCLLLGDEPTAALDRANATRLLDLLVSQARDAGAAVLISTHDPRCIERADRVVTMIDGVLQ